MELEFKRVGSRWVAEFEATGKFNLHIERKKRGSLALFQISVADGEYASESVWSDSAEAVVDKDFGAEIYPKYFKVTSGSEVVNGVVTMEGEGAEEDNPEHYPLFVKFTLSKEESEKTDSVTSDDSRDLLGDTSWGIQDLLYTHITAEIFYKKNGELIPYRDLRKWEITAGDLVTRDHIGLVNTTKEENRIVATYVTQYLAAGDYAYVLKINDTNIYRYYIYQV